MGSAIDGLGDFLFPLADPREEPAAPASARAGRNFRAYRPGRQFTATYGSAYEAANVDRFTQGWMVQNFSADAELFIALRALRARSRDMSKNDSYVSRYLDMIKTNVVGPKGIGIQNRARDPNGQLDMAANKMVEDAWAAWGKKGVCTVDGKLSFIDATNLFIETVARDGECLIRLRKNARINPFGFALEFVDVDLLDELYNDSTRKIRMSVQYNDDDRPINYYILTHHPNALFGIDFSKPQLMTVSPAADIIHAYLIHRTGQGRGTPWTTPGLSRLKMLSGYESAELINARVSASKMGFFTETEPESYTGDREEDGDIITEADPGTFERLPIGVDFKQWSPEHPVAAYEPYVLAVLRGVAAGFGVSYVGLSGDLRGVSYSSIRQGALDERDHWRTLQTFAIEHFIEPVFVNFLKMALTTQAIPLPPQKFDKFNAPVFRPRGWQWIDPWKEVNANTRAIQNQLRSLQQVVGESGADIEDILLDNQIAKEIADKMDAVLVLLAGINQAGAAGTAAAAGVSGTATGQEQSAANGFTTKSSIADLNGVLGEIRDALDTIPLNGGNHGNHRPAN